MDNKAARVSKVCNMAEDFETIHEFEAGFIATFERNCEQATSTFRTDIGHPRVIR